MIYRVKQFIWAATAKLTSDDLVFINSYLNDYEKKIFSSLATSTQTHSVKVAREVLEECLNRDLYDMQLIKASLLHDIGQVNSGLNCVTKSIMVIANRLIPQVLRKFNKIGFINAYYKHAEMALDILYMEPEYIKFLIKNHHNYYIQNDEKLKILQTMDSRN
ncbi:MAG: family phosphohydrolase [Clostridiales bacterium]|nr:family phosphohydrolase [Clostridiales bacterium]